jgi:hypothetical protein
MVARFPFSQMRTNSKYCICNWKYKCYLYNVLVAVACTHLFLSIWLQFWSTFPQFLCYFYISHIVKKSILTINTYWKIFTKFINYISCSIWMIVRINYIYSYSFKKNPICNRDGWLKFYLTPNYISKLAIIIGKRILPNLWNCYS